MSRILGLQIDAYSLKQAVSSIKAMLKTSSMDQVVTVNPEFLIRAEKEPNFKQLLKEASLRTADGVGVSLFSNFSFNRASGVDLILALAEELESDPYSFFLFGAEKGVAERTAQNLQKQFPKLDIAGTLDGMKIDENSKASAINAASPDILFVALGAGKQERWIDDHKEELSSCKVAIGVGGAFDILAGDKPRAPRIFRYLGLEWLWRLIIEPTRALRISKVVFYFPYLVLRRKLIRSLTFNNERDKPSKDK